MVPYITGIHPHSQGYVPFLPQGSAHKIKLKYKLWGNSISNLALSVEGTNNILTLCRATYDHNSNKKHEVMTRIEDKSGAEKHKREQNISWE